ncbi:SET domain [Macleaya cordata]|uniref:SET domain n=1 Tax=Macleaya cordata TaxID=56857 RepID=A0A200R368_MACCD|nr:SET domain [Macleaya cordata]
MEKLKLVVPSNLKRMISESTPEDLPYTCSSLLDFFQSLQLFHHVVRELTDPEMALCRKNADAALDFKRKGNDCFSAGDYAKALSFYSQQALCIAPMDDADDEDKNLVATLYVNRASSLHKMGLLVECIRDCNRAVVLLPSYAKAWYRRGMANASLENYEDAIHDLDIAMNMELSLGGKSRIKDELEIITTQGRRKSSSPHELNKKNLSSFVEPSQIKLKCVSTPTKGRGMASASDIPHASLIHSEEPYAVIILKDCRKTHCHFCLNKLPSDTVPCSSCSMALYCSQHCQAQAGGQRYRSNLNTNPTHGNISTDLERYIERISLDSNSGDPVADSNLEWAAEHRHECGGVHWPAVLPAEIILAGRVLVKSMEQRRDTRGAMKPMEALEICHNYACMPSESKLELHIYSIVLTYCLQQSCGANFPLNGLSASKLVVLISQIKVNSMAVVHMKSLDACELDEHCGKLSRMDDALTNNIEQVRVGQAIYSTGSLFNHSCQPNVHAYFLSRTLLVRATEFVVAGYPLELSYGPQVGQWDHKDRQKFLEDQYSFKCQCSGCSEMNLSDLVINAFSCVKPNCFGAVLDSSVINCETQEANCLLDGPTICSLEQPLPVDMLKRDGINEVAHLLFEQTDNSLRTNPGYCLNCGSYRDLESSREAIKKAETNIKRLQSAVASRKVPTSILSDALGSLDVLRSTMHAYSKYIAQVEDNFAEAFCLIGDFLSSVQHCKASIEILEKLYHTNHIVIGNELVKLTSIQQCLGDCTSAMDSINRLDAIFSLYYGTHAAKVIPYLNSLKSEAGKLVQQGDSSYASSSSKG